MKSYQTLKMISFFVFWLFVNSCATSNTLVQTPPPDIPSKVVKVSTIQKISFIEEENYSRIQMEGSETLEPPFYKLLSDPLRIAIDVPNIDLKQIKEPIKIDSGTVSEVLTTQFDDKGRIEIGLTQMTNYNIFKEDKILIIDIEKVKKIAEVKEEAKEEAIKEKEIEITPPVLKKEERPQVQPIEAVAAPETLRKAKEILSFLFDQKKDSITFNLVADGKIGNYDAFKLDSPPRLVLDIWEVDTRYPKNLIKIQNPFIKKVRIGHHPDKLRLVFECPTPQLPSYQVNRIGDKLMVSFGSVPQPAEPQIVLPEKTTGVIPPQKAQVKAPIDFKQAVPEAKKEEVSVRLDSEAVETKKEEVKEEKVKKEDVKKEEIKKEEVKKEEVKREEEKPIPELKKTEKVLPPVEKKPIPQTQVTKKAEEEKKVGEEVTSEKVYTGRRLSLDFKDADIKNILRLIAEVSNFNIITGDDVTGKVTMRLVDVPWDQALEIILQARSLGMSKVGNVIRIAPLDSLKKEIQAELEAKRTKEKLEDLVTELIPVNYATAKEILPQVKSILSERGDVKGDDRTNILIVKDIPRNIVLAKNLVKSLDTKTPQVLIEARIVEANLSFQKDLGISWGFLASTGTDKKKTLTVGSDTNKVVNLPAANTAGLLEFLFTSEYGLKNLDVAISAYENKGEAKVISSPKIATLDNKEASVEQGLRIPYTKLTTEGTPTEDFMEANLKLTVTPHVTNDGHVKMSIKVKKDEPDYSKTSAYGTPRINKKESTTEVLVKDNGVVAIAGIYTIKKEETTTGVPLFSKIPVLGWLFKKESKTNDTTDLLIFISPKILKD